MGHADKNAQNPNNDYLKSSSPWKSPRPLKAPTREALRAGLAFDAVEAELARGLHMRDSGQRILAFYLTDLDSRQLQQLDGYPSTAHYAEEEFGLSRRRARELISVGRKLLTLPLIDAAFGAGYIGWAKVLCLVRVASPEHERAWLKEAIKLPCRELKLEVRLSRAGGPPRKPGERKGLPEVRFPLSLSLDSLTGRAFNLAQEKLSAERGHPVNAVECLKVMTNLFLQLEEDGSVEGRTRVSSSLYRIVLREDPDADGELLVDTELGPVPIEDRTGIRCDAEYVSASGEPVAKDVPTPPALRRRVLTRDGNQCRHCRSRRDLMAHHIHARGKGGPTKAWNLITLCAKCHALVHDDQLVLEGGREGRIRFLRARKAAMEAGPRGERSPREVEEVLEELAGRTAVDPAPTPQPAPTPKPAPEPVEKEVAFEGFVGQGLLIERLDVAARASRGRKLPFPHTLFVGPPGTGKTSLARGVARLIGARVHETCGAHLGDTRALTRGLSSLQAGDVLFIDEIHAVPRSVLEVLYGALDQARKEGGKPFTLVAASTEEAELPDALRSRFGLLESLHFYEDADLAALAQHRAGVAGMSMASEAAELIARAARGTPRELLRLVERALDEATVAKKSSVSGADAQRALTRMGFDERGLHPNEQRYLKLLRRDERPVPLHRLARMLGLPEGTLTKHIEPFLFARGFVQTTRQGRALLGT